MATSITTIQSTDLITNSRADINNNFDSLLVNKIETDVIDVDSTFADASDSKIPSQLAVKQYVDAGGNPDIAAAQAGGGDFGTPSATNKFVTEDYITFINQQFGDGADGDVTISSPTTLTRDMYYNNLTVNSTLTTDGYRIFVKGTLTGTGTIDWGTANVGGNGSAPSGGSGATQSGSGFFKNTAGVGGGAGVNDTYNVAGSVGNSGTIGNAGAQGGVGGNGGINVASAGTVSVLGFGKEKNTTLFPSIISATGHTVRTLANGSGGAGGAWNNTGTKGGGGGSGASGGIIIIIAKNVSGTFTIKSVGGAGGNGGNGVGSGGEKDPGGGGGAGGNGGVSVMVYGVKTWTGSYNLAGGAGGAGGTGAGGGANGTAGSVGTTGVSYEYPIGNLI